MSQKIKEMSAVDTVEELRQIYARTMPGIQGERAKELLEHLGTFQDNWLDEEKNESFMLGLVVAAESLEPNLRDSAGKLFSQGKDEEAYWFRKLADEAKQTAKKLRSDYDKKYHNTTKS